jgi:hypothetical protein
MLTAGRRPELIVYACALTVALGIGWCVSRIPIQLTDSLSDMLNVQNVSWGQLMSSTFYNRGYLRPLRLAQIKLALDTAGGHYFLMYKSIHIVQVVLLAMLFVRLLRVGVFREILPACLAIAVLIGLHTFDGMVREAFPINHFLTIAICTLAAANLSVSRPHWLVDVGAAVLFVFATLTLESGVLVLVVIAAGLVAGFRGVSWRGATVCVLLAAGYFYLRFGPLGVGGPSLAERSSGYGFQMLDPPELIARFGDAPTRFYLYNVVSSILTVLFAEPRDGVWYAVRTLWGGGSLPAWLTVNLLTSVAATLLVGWYLARLTVRHRSSELDHYDRLVLVATAVLLANAAVSYGYTKSVIMSVGGVFFAVAVYVAARELLSRLPGFTAGARALTVAVLLFLAIGWTLRAVALPYRLRQQAFVVRNQWNGAYTWLDAQRIQLTTPEAEALARQLRQDALRTEVAPVEWTGWRLLLDLN